MEFTGVELSGGVELAAPVEKATAGPVDKLRRVRALQKAAIGGRRGGEGGRWVVVL